MDMSTTEIQDKDIQEVPVSEESMRPSALNTEALEAFAEEQDVDEPVDDVPASNADLDDVLKEVPERAWKVSGMLYGKRRQGRQIVDVEEPFEATYVQKPLSYLAMMQFTGLLGRKLDELMSGPEGISTQDLPSLMSVPDMVSFDDSGKLAIDFTQGDFAGVDSFVRGFAKLASYAPEILAEAQCIWLRVPPRERLAVIEIWSRPMDEGGLSMNEGEEMMDVFIHQNYEELERFFRERLRRWARRLAAERKRLQPPEED
jgi:hypothetical protein